MVNGPPTQQQGSGGDYIGIIQPPPIRHLTVYVEQFFGAGRENFGPERKFNTTLGVVWTSETKDRLSR